MKDNEYVAAGIAEVGSWPGVRIVERIRGTKQNRVVLGFEGRTRYVVYPHSPSDRRTGARNHVQDIRRVCRELGAERLPK